MMKWLRFVLCLVRVSTFLWWVGVSPVMADQIPGSTTPCRELEKQYLQLQYSYGQTLMENATLKAQKLEQPQSEEKHQPAPEPPPALPPQGP